MTPELDCARGVNPNVFFSSLFEADSAQRPVFVQRRSDEVGSGAVVVGNSTRCGAAPNSTTYVGLRAMEVYDRTPEGAAAAMREVSITYSYPKKACPLTAHKTAGDRAPRPRRGHPQSGRRRLPALQDVVSESSLFVLAAE